VKWLYVVDYDIATMNASRRVMFYEAINQLFMMHLGKDVNSLLSHAISQRTRC
jgi:hypothetical protein